MVASDKRHHWNAQPPPRSSPRPRQPSSPNMLSHRWWRAMLCAMLAAGALAQDAPAPPSPPLAAGEDESSRAVTIMIVTLDGGGDAAAALGALAVAALAARGVRAALVPAPPACRAAPGPAAPGPAAPGPAAPGPAAPGPATPGPAPSGPGARACRNDVLRALVIKKAQVALVPVPAAHPPHVLMLRDVGLTELGDAAPAARLACYASPPGASRPPHSLLDFADEAVAALYHLPLDDVVNALRAADSTDLFGSSCPNCSNFYFTPEWCSNTNTNMTCSTLLTDDESEARGLADVVRVHRLLVRIVVLGGRLLPAAERLRRAALLCSRAPDRAALARLRFAALAPPPCNTPEDECAFDPYRLLKVANERELHSPSAISILGRLQLTEIELRHLIRSYRTSGPEVAAAETLAQHRPWTGPPGEVRTAVMIPKATRREAFDASALRAAALLAEEDSKATETVSFKVELLDDQCASTLAFKYLTDALGAEFGALSGVAGPACGAAFADVARQSPTLAMPVLAYTAQAPPPAAAAAYAVLAAGDARLHTAAWAAFLAHMGWRRIAVLSELATRATLDVANLGVDVIVHVELPADSEDIDHEKILQWAKRAAAANARVLYVCAEDARVVRAALCAGSAAGLTPAAGAAWLLPAALPPAWLRPAAAASTAACSARQLRAAAAAHLSLAPAWLADWDDSRGADDAWRRRWRERCRRLRLEDSQHPPAAAAAHCDHPPAHAALLYDTLRMWDAALRRQLRAHLAALDNLHHRSTARALIDDVTTVRYTGLTGDFEWSSSSGVNGAKSGVRARSAPLVLLQWHNGTRRRVGTWRGAGFEPGPAALSWLTADGRAPDDGAERCALQPLADVLHSDCRAAFLALGASLLALLVAALGAAAWHCKRRAERKYRERLAALGLTRLNPKPGGLDRWEIPRERVVINRKLGTGAFGTVYGGHALLAEDRGWSAVAVKTLKAGASTEEKLDFLSEAEAMKRFDHKNVVRLLGVVTKTEPVCTVMEFMLYGDLKNYLLARRHLAAGGGRGGGGGGGGGGGAGAGGGDEVSAARLTSMALDAARALSYLAQLRYVHRDVAARNCLVSAHRVVKLADFGMTRLVFENDYYRFSRKGMLPVRWMAPESLALGVFSPASDVWSFGVLLYEIVTFGSLPFQGLSNAEVLTRVKAGYTLELPSGLKPQLEGLIKSCWQQEHKARPCAAEVAAFLADSPRLLSPCLDVPLDALPLDHDHDHDHDQDPWRLSRDRAEARWVSWAAPASATTDTTYLSADAPPRDTDAFLP